MTALPQYDLTPPPPPPATRSGPDAADVGVPFAAARLTPEALAGAERVLRSGWLTTGPEVASFEAEFAALVGTRNAVAVASCTAGLELSLRALDLPPGAQVLLSSVTFVGALHAVVHSGLVPVLADVDPVTAMPTPESTAAAARRCGGVAAMMVVHLYGDAAPVPALAEAAGLPLTPSSRTPRTGSARELARPTRSAVSPRPALLQLLRDQEPAHRRGRHGQHRRRRASRRACDGPGCTACRSDAWRRYLPGGGWRYDVDRARPQGQHDRPAGRHRPGPATAFPRLAGAGGPSSPPGTTRSSPGCRDSPFRPGPRGGRPRLAPLPGAGAAGRAASRRTSRADRLAERGHRDLGALHPVAPACRYGRRVTGCGRARCRAPTWSRSSCSRCRCTRG